MTTFKTLLSNVSPNEQFPGDDRIFDNTPPYLKVYLASYCCHRKRPFLLLSRSTPFYPQISTTGVQVRFYVCPNNLLAGTTGFQVKIRGHEK